MTLLESLIPAVHALSTLMLAGVIWLIQLVHYPLFARVGPGEFVRYQREHMRRITWLVGPLMLAEGLTAAWLVLLISRPLDQWLAWGGLALVLVNAASTALLQVPCHHKLTHGFDRLTCQRLVATNWLRTLCWSVRGVIALLLLRPAA